MGKNIFNWPLVLQKFNQVTGLTTGTSAVEYFKINTLQESDFIKIHNIQANLLVSRLIFNRLTNQKGIFILTQLLIMNTKLLKITLLLVVVFAQTESLQADLMEQPFSNPIKVTTVEGITEYRLENGLRVLLFPDNTKETITVNITYLVGSKHENYGETEWHIYLSTLFSKVHQSIPTFLRN